MIAVGQGKQFGCTASEAMVILAGGMDEDHIVRVAPYVGESSLKSVCVMLSTSVYYTQVNKWLSCHQLYRVHV
jgi:hypothetical protein